MSAFIPTREEEQEEKEEAEEQVEGEELKGEWDNKQLLLLPTLPAPGDIPEPVAKQKHTLRKLEFFSPGDRSSLLRDYSLCLRSEHVFYSGK